MAKKDRKTILVLAPSNAHVKLVRIEDLKDVVTHDLHVIVPEWEYQHLFAMFDSRIRQALIVHFGGEIFTYDFKDPNGFMGLLSYGHRVKAVVYVGDKKHEVTVWMEHLFFKICIVGASHCTSMRIEI